MPVIAPPPLTPQQGAVEVIRQHPTLLRLRFQNQQRSVQIEVSGAAILSAAAANAAVRAATTLSDAMYLLAQACVDAGYPVAQLIYARSGDTVYVQVELRGIAEVRGPPTLTRFFAGLDQQPLTETALEPRRLLASIYADSTGLNVQPRLIAEDAGVVLDFRPDVPEHRWPGVDLSFGNPGNRFVGRYFGSVGAHYGFDSGIDVNGNWLHGFPELDNGRNASDYDEQNLALRHISRFGVFGLSARNVDYQQTGPDPGPLRPALQFDSDIRQLEASVVVPVKAAAHWRWLAGASLDVAERQVDETSTATRVQDQHYASLQISTAYKYGTLSFERYPTELSAGITLRSGLGDDRRDEPQVAADLAYRLLRPEFGARLGLSPNWQLGFSSTAQITGDSLPVEQQWVLGGTDSLQAWLPGVSVGDRGVRLRFEVQRRGWQLGSMTITPKLFSEYGAAEFDRDGAGRQTLADIGVGLEARLFRLVANATTAQPIHDRGIDKAVLDDARAQLLFSLRASF